MTKLALAAAAATAGQTIAALASDSRESLTCDLRAPADPAVAAVDLYRFCWESAHELFNELDAAESAAEALLGRRPVSWINWRGYASIERAGIENLRLELLKSGLTPALVEEEYGDALARLRAQVEAGKVWDHRAGLVELRRQADAARDAAYESEEALSAALPSSLAGTGALLGLVVEEMDDGLDSDWHLPALRNAAAFHKSGPAARLETA